ncbi:MAG: ATP-binding cassette domain-containing protein [Zetaproteobacteria bacterium]|nr:MAG: ATP-binding cassette domain-containing protein [Zetaproteobacteria bacterium]
MIEAENLSRRFGDRVAVEGLSFAVARGEVMGLLGPNGAGKTTTMRMLTGFLPPSDGDARIDGISVVDDPIGVRRKIGYLPENAPSYVDLDARTHLAFIGRLHGLEGKKLEARIGEVAEACGIAHVLGQRIETLSKGYRQRVGLAAALVHDPELLILDEPTTGLDPNQVIEVRALIRELARERTVLLSTHILAEVEAVCDRAMIIDGGRLRAIGTMEELAAAAGGAHVRIRIEERDRLDEAAEALRSEGLNAETKDGALFVRAEGDVEAAAARAGHALWARGFHPVELAPERARLEEVFRKLTQDAGGRA